MVYHKRGRILAAGGGSILPARCLYCPAIHKYNCCRKLYKCLLRHTPQACASNREISVASIIKIANHFNITVDELLSLQNKETVIPSASSLPNISDLSDEDKSTVYRLIDLLTSERKLKEILKKDKAKK